MAIAARHAQRLATLGSVMAGCLGAYSLALSVGAYRIQRAFSSSPPTTDGSCAVEGEGGAAFSILHTLHQILLAPASATHQGTGSSPLPSKASLAFFPALCLACAALLVWRSRPRVPKEAPGQAGVDTATLARLLVEGKLLAARANLCRLLSNILVVLFFWRMSSLYGQQQQQAMRAHNDHEDDPAARLIRLWFSHCVMMAGLGLAVGLLNLVLYAGIQSQLRNLKHAVRHRVRAPTSGVAAGQGGMSSSVMTGL